MFFNHISTCILSLSSFWSLTVFLTSSSAAGGKTTFWAQDRGLEAQHLRPTLGWSRHGHSTPSLPFLSSTQAEIDMPMLEKRDFGECLWSTWNTRSLLWKQMLLCTMSYLAQRSLQEMKAKYSMVIFVHWKQISFGRMLPGNPLNCLLSTARSILTYFIVKLVWSSHQTLGQDIQFRGSMPCFCHPGELTKVALLPPVSVSTYQMEIMILILFCRGLWDLLFLFGKCQTKGKYYYYT